MQIIIIISNTIINSFHYNKFVCMLYCTYVYSPKTVAHFTDNLWNRILNKVWKIVHNTDLSFCACFFVVFHYITSGVLARLFKHAHYIINLVFLFIINMLCSKHTFTWLHLMKQSWGYKSYNRTWITNKWALVGFKQIFV